MRAANPMRGFTLIEIAIVLVIISVLAGSLLVPLSGSVDRARRVQVESELRDEVVPVLMAFAASGTDDTVYLPCPDCRDDGSGCPGAGATAGDGLEDRRSSGRCSVTWGVLPWVTLQLGEGDPWGAHYSYAVFGDYASSDPDDGIQLNERTGHPNPNLIVTTLPGSGGGVAGDALAGAADNGVSVVIVSHGPNRRGAMSMHRDADGNGIAFANPVAGTDEEENTDGGVEYFWRPPTDPALSDVEEFDDIVVWLSTYRLRAFLAELGRLPD